MKLLSVLSLFTLLICGGAMAQEKTKQEKGFFNITFSALIRQTKGVSMES